MVYGPLEYANNRLRERSAHQRYENADVTEGRMLVALACYPFDLYKGFMENVSDELKNGSKIRPFSLGAGCLTGAGLGLLDWPFEDVAVLTAFFTPPASFAAYEAMRENGGRIEDSIYEVALSAADANVGLLAGYALGKGLRQFF